MDTLSFFIGLKKIFIIGGALMHQGGNCVEVWNPGDEYKVQHVWTKGEPQRFVGWLLPVSGDTIFRFKENPKFDKTIKPDC